VNYLGVKGGSFVQETLAKKVYWLLRNTSSNLKEEFRRKIEDFGITWPQYNALYHIGESGRPVHELAQELQCNASNMTGIIDRMSDNGWVYREHSEEDRRIWLVKLTEDGARLKAEIMPQYKRIIKRRMSVLSQEELIFLQTLLTKLKDGQTEEDKS